MKNHIRLFEILFCIFALVLVVIIPLTVAGNSYTSMINTALGTSSYKEKLTVDESEINWDEYNYYESSYSTDEELKSVYENLCREVEEEGIVLLKNDNNALPLDEGAKVSLFGQGSIDFNYNTSGSSSNTTTAGYATLKDVLEDSGFYVNEDLWRFCLNETDYGRGHNYGNYHRDVTTDGFFIYEAPYSVYTDEVIATFSYYDDAAIVTISRDSNEGSDLNALGSDGYDGSYLSLSNEEIELLTNLTTLKKNGTFKSIIVLLNTSATVQLDFLEMDGVDVDAVLWVGNTGSHGAYAIGEVLSGKVNPSGRSVDTYLKNNLSAPAAASWASSIELASDGWSTFEYGNSSEFGSLNMTNSNYVVYAEGIYVGYRYFETRYEDYVTGRDKVGDYDYNADVAYPFGYGLSYTTFSYSNFSVTQSEDGQSFEVSVNVTNTGDVPGKETVEVYLQKPYAPYDETNDVEKASVELAGYKKTQMLKKGDNETVKITVEKEQFKSYDANEAETYILDEGDYYLTVGNGSHEAVNNILALKAQGDDSVATEKMDAEGDASLAAVAFSQDALDATTYSVSTETGAEITNQFDYADINKYENRGSNSVTYVSRSDWTGTFPNKTVTLSIANQAMYNDLQSDVKEYDQTGYEIPLYDVEYELDDESGLQLNMYAMREVDYNDPLWDDFLNQMSYEEQALLTVDGYHYTNGVSSVGKRETVDENGPTSVSGSVTGYCLPSEGVWAATYNDELIERVGELMGDDCLMADVQGLYAPGVNIHRTGFCGRTHEYFSEDPYLSGMASVAEIKGIQSKGVIAYVKHFAFNEQETNRNGISTWLNEQSAREIYLVPFEYAMRPSMGNAHASMTSFNRAGCTWTSASSELLLNVARDEWNFEGYYITDASNGNGAYYMTNYDGIMNGTNLFDGSGTSSDLDSYKDNARFCYMLRESSHRILYNISHYSVSMNGLTEYTVISNATTWWQALLTTLEVISIVGIVASVALYVVAEVFKWRDKKGNAGEVEGGSGVNGGGGKNDLSVSDGTDSSNDRE